jgi:hypothetical protein
MLVALETLAEDYIERIARVDNRILDGDAYRRKQRKHALAKVSGSITTPPLKQKVLVSKEPRVHCHVKIGADVCCKDHVLVVGSRNMSL